MRKWTPKIRFLVKYYVIKLKRSSVINQVSLKSVENRLEKTFLPF
jgi:hypothetical protein